MLLEFRFKNFRSFKDEQLFSLEAANIKPKYEWLITDNIFHDSANLDIPFLKSSVIYGANASGKSNLFTALSFFKHAVARSDQWDMDRIRDERFAFSQISIDQPALFEITFILDKVMYRYGFTTNYKEILSEWLYRTKKIKRKSEALLFTRNNQQFEVSENLFQEGNKKDLQERTLKEKLFLSVIAQWSDKISKSIQNYVKSITIISSRNAMDYKNNTIEKMKNDEFVSKRIISFVKSFDVSILNITTETENIKLDGFPLELQNALLKSSLIEEKGGLSRDRVDSIHHFYDESGKPINKKKLNFNFESDGTQKLLALAFPILNAFENGTPIFIDELDARFHPEICKKIIELFNSKKTNPRNAQLIFITHNTNLLKNSIFRRDQIWFCEKDEIEASQLYSLVDIKGVKNEASYDKDYIAGRYGGIPYLGDFEYLCGE